MTGAPLYLLDRSLCARCGNDGTLKQEGILDGCPDCATGREVRRQLREVCAEQAAMAPQNDGEEEW